MMIVDVHDIHVEVENKFIVFECTNPNVAPHTESSFNVYIVIIDVSQKSRWEGEVLRKVVKRILMNFFLSSLKKNFYRLMQQWC